MKHIRNWYQLLEGSGLAASDSGPGQAAGTLSADVTWCPFYHPPGTTYGYKGVVIGPSQSRIVSAAAAGFNWEQGSIEMLVRPRWNNADNTRHNFWQTSGGANKVFQLFKYTDNYLYLTVNSISQGTLLYAFVAETYYHVVLNWPTNELYINGVLAKDYSNANLGSGSSTLYIGDTAATANTAFNGDIFYFIARDVPLTLAQVAAFRAFFLKQYIPD